ncbi:transposase [Micromonospora sp. NPDC047707]|uniref:transposase n=1 Tax=Micromonospora sp. NPDC047707 TaxID=3154498 RepID=UPI00345721FC
MLEWNPAWIAGIRAPTEHPHDPPAAVLEALYGQLRSTLGVIGAAPGSCTGYLHQRWNDGERNATQLFREIQQQGYPGGELAVQRYLRRFRTGRGHAPHPGPKPPTVRQVTSWIMTHPDHLDPRDAAKLRDLRNRDRDLDRLVKHVRAFAVMMTGRHGDRLDEWTAAVEQDTLAPLARISRNLRRDLDAVRNGLTLPHSSGAVEGTINRLKMIKRQMFGRAGLDLLRKRVLLTH